MDSILEEYKDLIKSLILLAIISLPFIIITVINWSDIRSGYRGEDNKLDREEIKDMFRTIILVGFFLIFAFMLLSKGIFKYEYDLEDYILAYGGTIEAGILVILQYLKKK